VSAESGIPTFRDAGGLWERFPPEQFASLGGLLRTALTRPARFAEFLAAVLEPVATAEPNPAHRAIAALEARMPTAVVTQNIDGLHQRAGSSVVHEVHGSFFRVATWPGRRVRPFAREGLRRVLDRLHAARRGPLKLARIAWALRPWLGVGFGGLRRPRVVLFGEALAEPDWTNAQSAVQECDVLLTVGTSGEVFPAALVPNIARRNRATVITVDPAAPGRAHLWMRGPAGEVLPRLVEEVLRGRDGAESEGRWNTG
jgi:NAD-dependent deacetylase